jgi:hypothetical protein
MAAAGVMSKESIVIDLQEGTCDVIEEWFWWVLDAGQSFQFALYTSGAQEKAHLHQSIARG